MKFFAALALIALTPFSGYAQNASSETKPEATQPAKSDKIGFYALAYADYLPSTKIKAGLPGSVSRTVADGELIWSGKVSDAVTLDLDYEAKWTHNDFSDTSPYGDTESHFFGAHATKMFDAQWGAGCVGAIELASETAGDLFGDGLRGGAGVSMVWRPDAELSTESGFTVQTQFGQNPTISPYIRWKWIPSKSVELELRAIGLQNGVAGTWFITENKATSVRVSLFYENQQYALRDGESGVWVREIPLRIAFTQFLSESFFVSLRANVTLYRDESFWRDDRKVGAFRIIGAPGFGLLCGLRL